MSIILSRGSCVNDSSKWHPNKMTNQSFISACQPAIHSILWNYMMLPSHRGKAFVDQWWTRRLQMTWKTCVGVDWLISIYQFVPAKVSWHRPATRNGIFVLEINSKDKGTKLNQSSSDIKLFTAFTILIEPVIEGGFNTQLIMLLPQCPWNNLADHTYGCQINAQDIIIWPQ